MIYIYPYKLYSESARALRDGLSSSLNYRVKLVKPNGNFRPRRDDVIVNWGNSKEPNWIGSSWDLNRPESVANATNKLHSFIMFYEGEVDTPNWSTKQDEAQDWVNDGRTVVVRHVLNGHSGQGIEIIQEGEVPEAPLYVEYKKKRSEWRVHVFKGEVIDTCQKRKRQADRRPTTFNTFVRNHSTGWVFCRDNINPDILRDELAIKAIAALKLDFGAVDIIYNEHEDKYYVLEINTSPGLEGTTLQKYVEVLTQCVV